MRDVTGSEDTTEININTQLDKVVKDRDEWKELALNYKTELEILKNGSTCSLAS